MNSASAYALLRSSQISPARASSASAPRLPDADRQVSPPCGQIGDLPVPGRNVYRHARVSDLAGLQRHSRKRAEACCLPPSKNASAPETRIHSRLNGWPVDTPVNASRYASRRTRMTRGQRGSLLLCWRGRTPLTLRRFRRRTLLKSIGQERVRASLKRVGRALSGVAAHVIPVRSDQSDLIRCRHGDPEAIILSTVRSN